MRGDGKIFAFIVVGGVLLVGCEATPTSQVEADAAQISPLPVVSSLGLGENMRVDYESRGDLPHRWWTRVIFNLGLPRTLRGIDSLTCYGASGDCRTPRCIQRLMLLPRLVSRIVLDTPAPS